MERPSRRHFTQASTLAALGTSFGVFGPAAAWRPTAEIARQIDAATGPAVG